MQQFDSKSYRGMSQGCVGAKMSLAEANSLFDSYISNDYLGMSQRKETIEADINALMKYGTGACATQSIGGYLGIHQQLEQEISDFVGQEDAILFSSGFGANAGLLRDILGKNDIAYIDSYIHTSAISGLTFQSARNTTAYFMVDDAHGIGVMGNNERGTAEYYNCMGQVDIITGTFSKSFGCVGGFVAASSKLIQYLRYYADSNVFSAAITPQVTCSVLKALELIKTNHVFAKNCGTM